jgi:hypothetical protein
MFALAAGLLYVAAPSFWSTLIDVTQRGTGVLGGAMNGRNYDLQRIEVHVAQIVMYGIDDLLAKAYMKPRTVLSSTTRAPVWSKY